MSTHEPEEPLGYASEPPSEHPQDDVEDDDA